LSGFTNAVFLARQVATEPGMIIRPLANLFGFFVNFVFNIVYAIGPVNSLGITIIVVTIIFRALMLPMHIKSQKSMRKMQELKPELDKIKAKYGDTKDPELRRKMSTEQSALMAKHDANPLKGCFPLLLTMPLFMGLNFVLQQAFLYITRLQNVYYDLAVAIQRVPDYINIFIPPGLSIEQHRALPDYHANAVRLLPNSMLDNAAELRRLQDLGLSFEEARMRVGETINIAIPEEFARVINRFTAENWAWLSEQIPEYYWTTIAEINERRQAIESFFGLSMIEPSGWGWPSIIIPILVGVTMLCASWISQQRAASAEMDEKAKMQQRIMLIVMPIFLMFITVGFPAGLGVFWITGQVFQGVTDFIMLKKAGIPIKLPFRRS